MKGKRSKEHGTRKKQEGGRKISVLRFPFSVLLSRWRVLSFVKPLPHRFHPFQLTGRYPSLAGRALLTVLRRSPSYLGPVVGIVANFKGLFSLQNFSHGKRLLFPIAPDIGDFKL